MAARVEMEYYSAAYFQNVISVNFCLWLGSYSMRSCIDSCCIYTACLSPTLNGSSEISCFERSDVIAITLVFYPGLSQVCLHVHEYRHGICFNYVA